MNSAWIYHLRGDFNDYKDHSAKLIKSINEPKTRPLAP
jgi:hypothetical protein